MPKHTFLTKNEFLEELKADIAAGKVKKQSEYGREHDVSQRTISRVITNWVLDETLTKSPYQEQEKQVDAIQTSTPEDEVLEDVRLFERETRARVRVITKLKEQGRVIAEQGRVIDAKADYISRLESDLRCANERLAHRDEIDRQAKADKVTWDNMNIERHDPELEAVFVQKSSATKA